MTAGEDFLSRWARKKAEAKTGTHPDTDELVPPAPAAPPAVEGEPGPPAEERALDMLRDAPPDEETRAAWISKLEAIDLETLNYEDDFSVFLRSWVPQALRNRALKRLWSTSDVFDVLDGLAEYDEDYTDAATIIGEIKSSWRPGRGYARDEEVPESEDEAAAQGEDEGTAGETVEASADEPETGSADAPTDNEAEEGSENEAAPAKSEEDEDVG